MKFFGILALLAIIVVAGLYFYGLNLTPEQRVIEQDAISDAAPVAAE